MTAQLGRRAARQERKHRQLEAATVGRQATEAAGAVHQPVAVGPAAAAQLLAEPPRPLLQANAALCVARWLSPDAS